MAARQDRQLVWNPEILKLADEILREIDRKRQVVSCVQEQRLSIPYAIEVPAWADRLPQGAKEIELDRSVETLPNVLR
jgi:hypothetical protein